jgi:O-antigen/teichoic acid export membrane protein
MLRKIISYVNLSRSKIEYFSYLTLEKIIMLIFHFYFIRSISETFYGLYSQINLISSYSANILLFGLSLPLLVSSINKGKLVDEVHVFKNVSFLLYIILLFILLLFSNSFATIFFGSEDFSNYIFIFLIVLFTDFYSEYYILFNRINDKLKNHSIFILTRTFLRISSLILIYYILNDFFIAFIISSFIYLITSLCFGYNRIGFFKLNYFKEVNYPNLFKIFKKAIGFYFFVLTSGLTHIIISIYIVNQLDIKVLGIYSFNFLLASIPSTIISYIVFYSLPDFILKQSKSLKSNIRKDLLLGIFVFVIFFVFAIIFYDFIIDNLGDPFYSDSKIFIIFFSINLILLVNNFLQIPHLSKNNTLRLTLVNLLSNVLVIVYLSSINTTTLLTIIYSLIIPSLTMFLYLFSIKFIVK